MSNTPDSKQILSDLEDQFEAQVEELRKIKNKGYRLKGPKDLAELEKKLQDPVKAMGDTVVGIKIQEHLDEPEQKDSEQELVKASPTKMRNEGPRVVNIRLLGGTLISVVTNYYNYKGLLAAHKGKRGHYPSLLLLGVSNRHSPAMESLLSLFATAASSLAEARQLIKESLGFDVDVKAIRSLVKRLAARARACIDLDQVEQPDDFTGKIVAASTDGGRIRIRKNKRGRKTTKGRTRYQTDWREPKLLIIYVIGPNGRQEKSVSPIIDATLNGPDETFALLAYYLKKLQVKAADLLLFVSDGAKWIWERARQLAKKIGMTSDRCLFALDYYHAVEHLTELASLKRWDKKQKRSWINMQKKRLIKGKLKAFIESITSACKGSKNSLLKREYGYFKSHLCHMEYAKLKAQGLPIGSGAVESGIRRVINLRLKGPGIFWHEDSADAMLMLRSYYKAGRWEMLINMAHSGGLATR